MINEIFCSKTYTDLETVFVKLYNLIGCRKEALKAS